MRAASIIVLLLLSLPALAADFPAIEQLPSRPELPDPLVMLNGERVASKEQWYAKRRPELKELFQHYMYGYFPPRPEKLSFTVDKEDKQYLEGKATRKDVTIHLGPDLPKLQLTLVVPNNRNRPAPAFMSLNFSGNEAALKAVGSWGVDQIIDRGYALATMHRDNITPDSAKAKDALFLRLGGKGGDHDWAAIAAWAWGAMRGIDYLLTDKDIDPKRIAMVGHSRLGKASLLAAAFDDHIALAIPHQAGCGGTAPSRGKVGESVKQINDRFPHWFTGAFKQFNDKPDRLPFDQNCLVALCAPRPVLFSNAIEDTWANPDGQFQVLLAADPVYRFLDAGGLDAKQPPAVSKLLDSKLGYFIRPGKHSMTREDWKAFLDFADKQMK